MLIFFIHLSDNFFNRLNSPNASPQMVSRRQHAQILSSTSHEVERFDQEMTSSGHESVKEKEKKNSERIKKKVPWYSALYPTYKSRSEDFKRIFKDVIPLDERLIVDYSCAIQKDILVHGRLYASQNYLCFYANIFRWETMMSVQWKEVTAITKEKTALVIPNAILIHTNSEKHFLTSFGTRDKTYLMLFRIWQNALMDKSLSMQEIWQWVHACYGDELGLTSDDDDYVPPYNDCTINSDNNNYKFVSEIPLKEFSKDECTVEDKLNGAEVEKITVVEPSSLSSKLDNRKIRMEVKSKRSSESRLLKPLVDANELTTDVSDNTDTDEDQPDVIVNCPSAHDGRLLVQLALPFSVDHIFTLLFTESEFMKNLHESRKNTDVSFSSWEVDSVPNQKIRKGTLVVPITQPVGPKTSHITETQIMLNCSKPGNLYVIDTESNNAGIPYADSFYISSHFCIIRNPKSSKECTLYVYSQIKYRKSVWGLVKSFIEKNCWSGLEEYFNSLSKALEGECEKSKIPDNLELSNKRKVIRKRRCQVLKTVNESSQLNDDTPSSPLPTTMASVSIEKPNSTSEKLSWAILFTLILLASLNGILYYKLWSLEAANYFDKDMPSLKSYLHRHPPRTPEEWLELLYKQEKSYHNELSNWDKLVKSTISLLRQAEESLNKLERNFQQVVSEQVLNTLKNSMDLDNNELNNQDSESELPFSNKI